MTASSPAPCPNLNVITSGCLFLAVIFSTELSLFVYLTRPHPALSDASLRTTSWSAVTIRWLWESASRGVGCLGRDNSPWNHPVCSSNLGAGKRVEHFWCSGVETDVDQLWTSIFSRAAPVSITSLCGRKRTREVSNQWSKPLHLPHPHLL